MKKLLFLGVSLLGIGQAFSMALTPRPCLRPIQVRKVYPVQPTMYETYVAKVTAASKEYAQKANAFAHAKAQQAKTFVLGNPKLRNKTDYAQEQMHTFVKAIHSSDLATVKGLLPYLKLTQEELADLYTIAQNRVIELEPKNHISQKVGNKHLVAYPALFALMATQSKAMFGLATLSAASLFGATELMDASYTRRLQKYTNASEISEALHTIILKQQSK